MSVVSATRTQRREKSNNIHKGAHASAEEIRLAQIIHKPNIEEDQQLSKNVDQIIEVTGTSEENARIALYDSNNDPSRAIELILESNLLDQTTEWETAGKKKNKQNTNSVRSVDTLDDESKEDALQFSENFDKPAPKGRGRGKSLRGRGKSNDPDRNFGNDSKGNFESRERNRERRGRGRGFGRGGRRGGGPPRRRYHQNRSENFSNDFAENGRNDFTEKFGTFTNSSVGANHAQTNHSLEEDEEWGTLEVGTWSNDDSQKQTEKTTDSLSEAWGTGSWNDDLVESQVFQSQQISNAISTQSNHASTQGTAPPPPQMGERIDLGALFKKNHAESGGNFSKQSNSDSLIGQSGIVFNNNVPSQHSTPSVIQQLQQQGQSNSLFSNSKVVNDIGESKSRLFGAYERQSNTASSNNSADIGAYSSRTTESSFSQYKDSAMPSNDASNSLLGNITDQFKSSEQAMRLGQMSDLQKSPYTSITQAESQNPSVSSASAYQNFSQAQQREATEAVKASLGLPSATGSGSQAGSVSSNLNQNEAVGHPTLSFGAPQPVRIKQQRKKLSTMSKIPSSAVEMPGAGGGNYLELSNFDLQFGIDDSAVNGAMIDSTLQTTQTSIYNSNVIASPASLINHMTSGNLEETSIFSTQLASQSQQVRSQVETKVSSSDSSTSVNSQRYSESLKSSESTNLRGPPGIPHPQSLPSATSSGTNLGVLSSHTQPSPDLSSSGGSYVSGRMTGSNNMPSLTGITHEASAESSQNINNQIHSYYSTQPLSQQSQHLATQEHATSAGRSLRSPTPTSQKPITGTPSKDTGNIAPTSISSLASSYISPHVGATPTKIQTTSSAPISILGSTDSSNAIGTGSGGYGAINMGYSTSSNQSAASQSSTPVAASPGKHLTNNDLYTSAGLSSAIHINHQVASTSSITSTLNAGLANSVLSLSNTGLAKSSLTTNVSKPPNLPLGPPLLPANQYGIPMAAPGLTYMPEALYGYTDPLVARVHHQMPSYYDIYNSSNLSNTSSLNRESNVSSSSQGKFGRGEPSSPTSLIGVVNSAGATNLAQQQLATGQHGTQLKVTQSGAHQAQPFMNLPAAAPAAAYAGYSGLYYNAFQYPPMFAAAATAVPNAKHQGNASSTFQQPAVPFANMSSINVSSASNLHDLQGTGYSKNHVTLTAAMAAANTGAAAGAGPGMNPYTQAPFMTVLPTHQHSQIHLHLPQHGDAGQSVGSQRSQDSNPLAKSASKGPFGNAQYWGN